MIIYTGNEEKNAYAIQCGQRAMSVIDTFLTPFDAGFNYEQSEHIHLGRFGC